MVYMKHLTVGLGEVGSAIHKIVGGVYTTISKTTWDTSEVDVIHICIPYSEKFKYLVEEYKGHSDLIIVHSTVPVGTCDALGVVHSPIRGVHTHLIEGIRTFVKYFGGKNAKKAAKVFSDLGIKTKVFKEARTTEALKLWDTTYYGKLIMIEKEIHTWCVKNNIDFDAIYREANKDYNEGYIKLGRPEVVRPYLKHMEGPIGGHCIRPNCKLLGVKL
jgi:UDP-N-acetyl-D-mannosaminuronate dehydrogenase